MAFPLTLPRRAHLAAQQRAQIIALIVQQTRTRWDPRQPMDPNVWFELHALPLALAIEQAQLRLVADAAESTDELLLEQGYDGPTQLVANPDGFAGVTGNGQPVLGLAYSQALKVAMLKDLPGVSDLALQRQWSAAGTSLQVAVSTALSDTWRLASLTQLGARPRAGWVRVTNGACCARCAVLAGRKGNSPSVGYRRHPGCDCGVMPVADLGRMSDAQRNEWILDPKDYFDSLSEREQDRIFTKAGAAAIRDGADVAQVVNARRGMSTTVDRFGFKTVATTEGTTKRGWASRYLRTQYRTSMAKQGGRYERTLRPRLMPEEIYKIAGDDPDMALNLLHKNGFLTDASATLNGRWSWASRDADVRAAQDRTFQKLRDGRN